MNLGENAAQALRMVAEAPEIVYDTETTGLDWRYNSPIGYVIGAAGSPGHITQDDVVYVPIRHGGGGNVMGGRPMTSPTEGFVLHPFEEALQAAFVARRNNPHLGRVVGHHTKFDAHFSANAGILLGRQMACTQNMAALLDEYQKSFSLDSCARLMEVTEKKGDALYEHMARMFGGAAERGVMEHFWKTSGNDEIVVDYTVGDGVSTMELWWAQKKKISLEELDVVADLENDLIWTIFRAERKGIRVDMEQIDHLRYATELKVSELLRRFKPGFNSRSPLDMKELIEKEGLTGYPTTEKGNPSFTEKWLKQSEVGRAIIEIRQATNLINSFVDPLAKVHVYKGRVHATLNQLKADSTGTISGRFSCNSPNLQQVPKRNKDIAKPFRRLFIADEGHIFWERDYSQCEPRLFAHYAQDPNLLKNYNAVPFVDAHQTVADLLNVERDPTAKRMNMGIFTGMQIRAFAGHMNWDLDKATDAFNAWFRAFPGIKKFQYNAKERLRSRGFVYTLLKRRCRLEEPRFAYHGTSKIIQGSNADILKWKFLEVDRICEDNGDIVQILMTVHDSFNGQFEDTPEARALLTHIDHVLEQVQCEPFNLSVPFVVEGHEGPNWAVATFGSK